MSQPTLKPQQRATQIQSTSHSQPRAQSLSQPQPRALTKSSAQPKPLQKGKPQSPGFNPLKQLQSPLSGLRMLFFIFIFRFYSGF